MNHDRKLRIVSPAGDVRAPAISITDYDTGEAVQNVFHISIDLDVNKGNTAKVTSYEAGHDGHLLLDENHNPIERTDTVQGVEVDVTAYEIREEIKELHESLNDLLAQFIEIHGTEYNTVQRALEVVKRSSLKNRLPYTMAFML